MKSVVAGLKDELAELRREHLDLKASHQQSLGKIKALQDRVSAQGIQKVRSQDFLLLS